MTLRDSKRYRREVSEVADYYESIRADLACDFLACVGDAMEKIATHPLAFRERREAVRLVTLRRFPYALRFRVLPSGRAVQLLSLRHCARKPE
jgi:hypothetical protein